MRILIRPGHKPCHVLRPRAVRLAVTCFNGEPLMDVQALQRDLESQIDGEVRFDTVSRALYSTDASVYQIEPLGVVVARSREDVVRAVEIAARHGVSITRAAAARRRPARRSAQAFSSTPRSISTASSR